MQSTLVLSLDPAVVEVVRNVAVLVASSLAERVSLHEGRRPVRGCSLPDCASIRNLNPRSFKQHKLDEILVVCQRVQSNARSLGGGCTSVARLSVHQLNVTRRSRLFLPLCERVWLSQRRDHQRFPASIHPYHFPVQKRTRQRRLVDHRLTGDRPKRLLVSWPRQPWASPTKGTAVGRRSPEIATDVIMRSLLGFDLLVQFEALEVVVEAAHLVEDRD